MEKKDDKFSEDQKIIYVKNELKKKPYIFFNKYGDVKIYSQTEFDKIVESEMIYNYFDKFSILNNKTDILFMNDYDFIFLIFLDGKKIDYTHESFRLFRKIFFNLNFFNVKFFVSTNDNRDLFNFPEGEDVKNNIFVIKRKNCFDINENSNKNKEFLIERERFEMCNMTKAIEKTNISNLLNKKNYSEKNECNFFLILVEFNKELMKILMENINFFYYSNNSFKYKQGLEIIDFYVKDMDSYIYYTNLKDPENIQKLKNIINSFIKSKEFISKPYTFVVLDNEKVKIIFKISIQKI